LLNTNVVVSVDEIVEHLWGENPPQNPRAAVQTCVTRLRGTLDRPRPRPTTPSVDTSAAGYLLPVETDQLDLLQFRELRAAANRAAQHNDLDGESRYLDQALDLWQGPVLADAPSDSLHRDVVPALLEEHLRAVERRNDVELALGRHDDLVGELGMLTRRHNYRERLWHQLMVALYRGGRKAEALQAYAEIDGLLRDEFGVNPGDELQSLQLAILRSEA
jgi:DNA-binding SARP family transcriptional activator